MTCRHSAGDRNCSGHPDNIAARVEERRREEEAEKRIRASLPPTPDAANYEVVDVLQVGKHLVTKVQYPNCAKCSYEGLKVMVFLNCTALDAIRWRKIDPHFRDKPAAKAEAPAPAARFPASDEGWKDALEYAERKKQCSPF